MLEKASLQGHASIQGLDGRRLIRRLCWLAGILLLTAMSTPVSAQEVRYSWLDLSFMGQDVERLGTQVPLPGQTVDVDASDGDGVRFRGSFGTWHNLYVFIDYGSTDIDVAALVTNAQGQFPSQDEFDYTTIRGGAGLRIPIGFQTDIYGEVSYDSLDFDFGSFAGEDFDADEQDIGGAIGVRAMLNDDLEVRAYGRYSSVGDVDLNTKLFESDTLFGAGFGWQIIRGLSIVADYESGEFSSWSFGFRLDLDED
ncbi:MAG: outer membrane beta-barrel protein [Woeseia sp.]